VKITLTMIERENIKDYKSNILMSKWCKKIISKLISRILTLYSINNYYKIQGIEDSCSYRKKIDYIIWKELLMITMYKNIIKESI
jgi:hypothetical protein